MISKLELNFRKLFAWKLVWDFVSIFKWCWLEFEDFRRYEQGDDIKRISRKMSAKNQDVYINLFKEEKDVDIHILLDINYNWVQYKDVMVDLIVQLSAIAKKYGANISICYYNNWFVINRPTKNSSTIYSIVKNVERFISLQKWYFVSNITNFLNNKKKYFKRHIIVMISDFIWLKKCDINLLKVLKKNELIFISIPVVKKLETVGKWDLKNVFYNLNFDRTIVQHKENIIQICKLWKIIKI